MGYQNNRDQLYDMLTGFSKQCKKFKGVPGSPGCPRGSPYWCLSDPKGVKWTPKHVIYEVLTFTDVLWRQNINIFNYKIYL